MNEANFEPILRAEFHAEEGSFLLRLRTEFFWDKTAFSRLITAMEACAAFYADSEVLPRWVAEGFWFVETFTVDHSSHPNFPRPDPPEYYQSACERLRDLSYWFFHGESPLTIPMEPL